MFIALFLAVGAILPPRSLAVSTEKWTATWGASQQLPYGSETLPKQALNDATLRQVVHVSIGGSRVRLHLSNAFGERPLVLRTVHVGSGQANFPGLVELESDRVLTFNGSPAVSIPAGAEYLSDPIDMSVAPLSNLVITMMIDSAPDGITFHSGARATSFLLSGDHVADAQFIAPQTVMHWYFLAGVEVAGGRPAGAVVTLGDSITDGHGATTDGNDRWPDVLARRLATLGIGVVNQGIGGNCILQDCLGPNALARFDRDVLSTPGVRYLIVLEGINDLGGLDRIEEHSPATHEVLVEELEGAFRQMVERAHAHGIRVYGATVTPYLGSGYYHPSVRSETDRQTLNRWIRTSGTFDDVIDFDAVIRDPARPDHMAVEVDSGDHLHPGPLGYKHMGESIALKLFKR